MFSDEFYRIYDDSIHRLGILFEVYVWLHWKIILKSSWINGNDPKNTGHVAEVIAVFLLSTKFPMLAGFFRILVAIEHVGELAIDVYNVENNGVRAGFSYLDVFRIWLKFRDVWFWGDFAPWTSCFIRLLPLKLNCFASISKASSLKHVSSLLAVKEVKFSHKGQNQLWRYYKSWPY